MVRGRPLEMDEAYRLAHLPLVAPNHPKVVARRPGAYYEMGRHESVHSIVLPIPAEALDASFAYRALDAELRSGIFAGKIAWDVVDARRDRLHATVCGGYGAIRPEIPEPARRRLRDIGPFVVEVRGIFSGNVNVGRLYLRVYPESRNGSNVIQALQSALGRPVTDLYVVGVWNLTDALDAREAAALAAMIETGWDRVICRLEIRELALVAARDDLVLDAEVLDRLPLA